MEFAPLLVSVLLGVALAAATGLRVFAPFLVLSVAAHTGHWVPPPTLDWLAGTPALLALMVATLAETLAYYIPGVDHLLDTLTTPLALIAGTLLVVAPLWDLPPLLKWSVAIIAGGGAAGLTQGATAVLRAKSSLFTAGLGNPVLATGETGGALMLSVLALAMPLIACVLVALALFAAWRVLRRLTGRAAR